MLGELVQRALSAGFGHVAIPQYFPSFSITWTFFWKPGQLTILVFGLFTLFLGRMERAPF